MSTDYFANVVYGVQPEGPHWQAFHAKLEEAICAANEDPDNDDNHPEYILVLVRAMHPELWHAVREEASAPDDADLFYTDSEDDRPGRCDTEAEIWLLGYGLAAFPRDVPDAFRAKADWHTWVTAG